VTNQDLQRKADWARRTVLEMAVKADSGHVTTAYSLAEIFAVLYNGVLRFDPKNPQWEGRDRFILSEGQAGIGLYPFLADAGFFAKELLENFTGEGSTMGVHSEPATPGVEVLTGSLGYGLSLGCGMAHAAKLARKDWRTLVLVGDGELTEGSNDEALRVIGGMRLGNFWMLVNRNGQSTIGRNENFRSLDTDRQRDLPLEDLDYKFKAYGFQVVTVNGHNVNALVNVFRSFHWQIADGDKPVCIIANTEKGYGCHLANQRGWHYRVPKGEDLERIRRELPA
jgi:transketolase